MKRIYCGVPMPRSATVKESLTPALSLRERGQSPLRLVKYVDAIREALDQEMARDEKVFVFGLDVDDHKSIQGSTAGLVEKYGPERCFGTPLSEDAMTGVAIGAAMAGYRPVHVHIRMDFLMLAMNQLVNMAAKSHYMYNGQVSVPLVVRTMIGRSWGQGAQHSQALHSMFMHVPGIKVVAPSNAHDAKGALIAAIRDNNPVIFMEHRLLCNSEAYVSEEAFTVELGKGRVVVEGTDVTIVAISHMVMEALRAQKHLEAEGIKAEIIDPISLKPLDIDLIVASVKKTGRLLVVDNGWLNCGASAEMITQVLEKISAPACGGGQGGGVERYEGHPPPSPSRKQEGGMMFARMGFAETTCPTTRPLEQLFYPSGKTIASRAYEMVKGKKGWEPSGEIAKEIEAFKGPF